MTDVLAPCQSRCQPAPTAKRRLRSESPLRILAVVDGSEMHRPGDEVPARFACP